LIEKFPEGAKFADLIRKAHDGSTKGNLGAIRSALGVYYADNEGWYPSGTPGFNITFLQDSLTADEKYLEEFPTVYASPFHPEMDTVDAIATNDAYAADNDDDGEWVYVSNSSHGYWGTIMVECYHTDARGTIWTMY